jgi:Squalene/phytoene synthase
MKNYRQQELNVQQNQTLDEMEDFAENAHSSILYILLNMFGSTDEDMSFAASHVGVCSGMVTQLRGMAQMAAQVPI